MFNNSSILITGGTGSLGQSLVNYFIKNFPKIKRLVIFSRDEYKQFLMQEKFDEKKNPFLRYFVGDIRDYDRLKMALVGIDYVIHAAALKQVPTAEYNPFEFIQTNIIGSQNVVRASLENNVKKVIALSTDKACSPVNLYGATKLCSDKLFISSNNLVGEKETSFSVVRYGNVFASRGSIIPFFLEKKKNKETIPLTHESMTRFNISMREAIETIIWSFKNCIGREIVVPKLKSFNIVDLIKIIDSSAKVKIIGIRPGEKIHEELISQSDSRTSIEYKDYYLILPEIKFFEKYSSYKNLKENFSYKSSNAESKMSLSELQMLIKKFENEN